MSRPTWVSPVMVYRAASESVRVRFWITVAVYIGMGSVTAFAASEGELGLREWLSPSVILAAVGMVYGGGSMVGELRQVKKELESRARIDVVAQQFNSVMTEIGAVRELVQRTDERWKEFLPTVNGWTNEIERKVGHLGVEVAEIRASMQRKH